MEGNGFQDIETDNLIFEEVTSQSCDHAQVCYLLFPSQTQSSQKCNPYVEPLKTDKNYLAFVSPGGCPGIVIEMEKQLKQNVTPVVVETVALI